MTTPPYPQEPAFPPGDPGVPQDQGFSQGGPGFALPGQSYGQSGQGYGQSGPPPGLTYGQPGPGYGQPSPTYGPPMPNGPGVRASAARAIWTRVGIGAALFVVGLIITVATYGNAASSPGGGTYFIAWGPMLAGVFMVIRGLISLRKLPPR